MSELTRLISKSPIASEGTIYQEIDILQGILNFTKDNPMKHWDIVGEERYILELLPDFYDQIAKDQVSFHSGPVSQVFFSHMANGEYDCSYLILGEHAEYKKIAETKSLWRVVINYICPEEIAYHELLNNTNYIPLDSITQDIQTWWLGDQLRSFSTINWDLEHVDFDTVKTANPADILEKKKNFPPIVEFRVYYEEPDFFQTLITHPKAEIENIINELYNGLFSDSVLVSEAADQIKQVEIIRELVKNRDYSKAKRSIEEELTHPQMQLLKKALEIFLGIASKQIKRVGKQVYELALNYDNPNAHRLLLQYFLAVEDFRGGKKYYTTLVQDKTDDYILWENLSILNYFCGRTKLTLTYLYKAHDLNPLSIETLACIVYLMRIEKNRPKFLEYVEKLLTLDPNHTYGILISGIDAFENFEFSRGLNLIERAAIQDSKYIDTYQYFKVEFIKYGQAYEQNMRILANDANNALANEKISQILLQLKEYEKAYPYLAKLTQLDPNNVEFCLKLGFICLILHRYVDGTHYYDQAVKIKPKDAGIRRAYIFFLIYSQNQPKAIEQMEKLVSLDSGAYDVMIALFNYYLSIFNIPLAIKFLKKAAKIEKELKPLVKFIQNGYKRNKDNLNGMKHRIKDYLDRKNAMFDSV
jgi:tetratricopeptide (TPR) repeat protein